MDAGELGGEGGVALEEALEGGAVVEEDAVGVCVGGGGGGVL